MAIFNVETDDELAKEFKTVIIRKYGKLRGNMDKAFSEAMRLWIKEKTERMLKENAKNG